MASGEVRLARINAEPLALDVHLDAIEDATAGAVTTFVGKVRDHDPDAVGAVTALEYSAHPDAESTLRELAERLKRESFVAVSHRIGHLAVGDAAVIIAVASAHRGEAFEVCRDIIEAIKVELPVWKRQRHADGTAAWKGLGG